MLAGAVALPQDRGLIGAHRQMAVDAVDAGVERPVLEPLNTDVASEAGVFDLRIGLDPIEPLALLTPEAVWILDRLLIELEVLCLIDPRGSCCIIIDWARKDRSIRHL